MFLDDHIQLAKKDVSLVPKVVSTFLMITAVYILFEARNFLTMDQNVLT